MPHQNPIWPPSQLYLHGSWYVDRERFNDVIDIRFTTKWLRPHASGFAKIKYGSAKGAVLFMLMTWHILHTRGELSFESDFRKNKNICKPYLEIEKIYLFK